MQAFVSFELRAKICLSHSIFPFFEQYNFCQLTAILNKQTFILSLIQNTETSLDA